MFQAFNYLVTAAVFAVTPVDARLKDLGVEMVLDTPGRTGACDVLRFTPDGKHLLAAGDDKVVRVWNCDGNILTAADVPVLRWSIYREHRGGIYAVDLAPGPDNKNGFRVAIAGVGLRNAAVAILDSKGNVRYGIPPFTQGKQQETARTLGAIWSMAYEPQGQRVALGGSNGSVWLWDLQRKSLRLVGRHSGRDGNRRGTLNEVRLVSFTAPDRLLTVAADGLVLKWDLKKEESEPHTLFQFEKVKNLACVAIDPAKQWLAAGGQTFAAGEQSSVVEMRSLDGQQRKELALPERNFPKCLAFDSTGRRLAVGTYSTTKPPAFYLLTGGATYLFDLSKGNPSAVTGPKLNNYVDAIAFHPDGKHLAVSGGDDHEVTLWELDRLTNSPIARVAGPGHCLWSVGISKDLRYLGYRDQREPVPEHPNRLGRGQWQVFDLKERRFARPAEAKKFEPVASLDECDGWSVKPDELDGTVWYVVKGDVRHKVPLALRDKFPRCFTFLKADDEHGTRLVVGHIWGMSVFALGDKPPVLVRKFAGHQGEVMAVAPSADGKFLVTASRDQTVAIWSLLPQKHQDELGASFEKKGNRLVVKAVAPGSPAWEARLERGDEVTNFASDGSWIKGGPEEWLTALKNPTPGQECAFLFDRGGTSFATLTTVRQRPLARFFPMDDREWVLYRYYDFYYDCSTNGDRYVAWQLSGDVDTRPRFDPLERYRKRFFKPEKVEELFADLSASPERISLTDIEPPQLVIDVTPDKLANGTVQISITARSAGDRPEHRLEQVNLWSNGAIIQEWKIDDTKFFTRFDLPAEQLRQGTNVLTVQAYNQAEVRRQVEARVECSKPSVSRNLYALIIGVGDYKGGNAGLSNLSAGKDALAVEQVLVQQKKLFANTNIITLRDRDVSRDRILEELTRLAKVVRPDDTFVLFLAGHGASGKVINGIAKERLAKAGERGGIKPDQRVAPHLFVFCTHDFALDKPLATGLPSEALYQEIRRLNCRTLLLLDACHSGTIIEDPVRQLTPEGVGPVILSACERQEPATEDPILGLQYTQGRANGLFTIALILALEREFSKADSNHDRILTVEELDTYLRQRVPKLLQSRIADNTGQHPTGSLPKLEENLPIAAR